MQLIVLNLLCCAALFCWAGVPVKRATDGDGVTCVVTGNSLYRNGVYVRELLTEEQNATRNYQKQLTQWLQAKYTRNKLPAEPTTPSFCAISSDQPPNPTTVECSVTADGVTITWYNIGEAGSSFLARKLTDTEKATWNAAQAMNNTTGKHLSPLQLALSYPCVVMHTYSDAEQST